MNKIPYQYIEGNEYSEGFANGYDRGIKDCKPILETPKGNVRWIDEETFGKLSHLPIKNGIAITKTELIDKTISDHYRTRDRIEGINESCSTEVINELKQKLKEKTDENLRNLSGWQEAERKLGKMYKDKKYAIEFQFSADDIPDVNEE